MTTNSQEDIDTMINWLSGVVLRAQIERTERNQAIEEEIKECIRSTLIKARKTK